MTAPTEPLDPADRRLAALAAVYAPDAAGRILGRVAHCAAVAAWGQALAGRPRVDRLAALADALAPLAEPSSPTAREAVLGGERPAVARALRSAGPGPSAWPPQAHPLLVRAARERLAAAT